MKVHAINAEEGDCLLLESQSRFALIDGGIAGIYEKHLRPYLKSVLEPRGKLNAAIVSHVDKDHITGILDLLADIEEAIADGRASNFDVADLWHNSFGSTLDTPNKSLSGNLLAMVSQAGRVNLATVNSAAAILSVAQGMRLRRLANKLRIPVNAQFSGKRVTQEAAGNSKWALGAANILIVGPTEENLRKLQREWSKWIEDHADAFAMGNVEAMANADNSAPNLSSIVLFAETPFGDALFTGDARGDHILEGLEQAGLLEANSSRPLRMLKIQHHGSSRNIDEEFVRRLPADIYLFSANGKHGNPDPQVLSLVVDMAQAAGRMPILVATNETSSLAWLREHRPQTQYGYQLVVRDPGRHSLLIDLQSGSVT